MAANPILNPFSNFLSMNAAPFTGAKIYIGQPNQDPETSPMAVYRDAALTLPLAQPLQTIGGYIAYMGTPTNAYPASTPYSIRIRDKDGNQVFYVASAGIFDLVISGTFTVGGNIIGGSTFNHKLSWGNQSGWLESLIANTESASRFKSIDILGGIGVLGATRSSDSANAGGDSGHGGSFYGINDNATQVQSVHGLYTEARRAAGAGSTLGIEMAVTNRGSLLDTGPYTSNPTGTTSSGWATGGRDEISGTPVSSSTFFTVYKSQFSGTPTIGYRAGLVYDFQSLDPNGLLKAIALPYNYRINWVNPDGSSMDIVDKTYSINAFNNTVNGTVNITRGRAGGGDAQAGDFLATFQGYRVIGGVTTFGANVFFQYIAGTRVGAGLTAVNDTGAALNVGLNTVANNSFAPNTDNSVSLGASGNRWSVVYAGTGAINTSDERTKTVRGPLTDAEKAAFRAITVMVYQFNDAIEAKGADKARFHVTPTAQAVQTAFAAQGLDAFHYGLLGQDPWMEEYDETYTEEVDVTETVEAADERIEIVDGTPTLIKGVQTVERPIVDYVEVKDESGSPVMDQGLPAVIREGVAVRAAVPPKPLLHPVPRTQSVTKTRKAMRQKVDAGGNPMFLMNLRDNELAYGMFAAMVV